MSTTSFLRGHPIFFDKDEWFYVDSGLPTIGSDRPCGHCGKENNNEGHDGCLGTLPGVMNACCGHGDKHEGAYIQYSSKDCLYGQDAINEIERLKKGGNKNNVDS